MKDENKTDENIVQTNNCFVSFIGEIPDSIIKNLERNKVNIRDGYDDYINDLVKTEEFQFFCEIKESETFKIDTFEKRSKLMDYIIKEKLTRKKNKRKKKKRSTTRK